MPRRINSSAVSDGLFPDLPLRESRSNTAKISCVIETVIGWVLAEFFGRGTENNNAIIMALLFNSQLN